MFKMDLGTVQSNWKPTEDKQIKDAIQWCFDGQSSDVEDTIQAENCVLLEPVNDSNSGCLSIPACQIVFTCPPSTEMQHISVLSEARIIEIYGHHDEYLQTCRSDLVEEVDDMAVFRTEIILERPLLTCCLKFTSLKSKKTMWLYGIRVIIAKSSLTQTTSKIPLYSVEQRLSQMEPKLSERAELFKTLIASYQSSQGSSNTDFSSLAPLLQMLSLISTNKGREADPKRLESSIPSSASSEQGLKERELAYTKQKPSGNIEYDFNENLSSRNIEKMPDTNSNYQAYGISDSRQKYSANFMNGNQNQLLQEKRKEYSSTSRNSEFDALEFCARLEDRLTKSINEQLKLLEHKLLGKVEQKMQEIEQKITFKLDEIFALVKSQR